MLVLYCTENYATYSKQIAGIGVAIRVDTDVIEYRCIPFATPLRRELIEHTFEAEDYKKMQQLHFNTRRVFEISQKSFANTLSGQALTWKWSRVLKTAAARKA